MIYNFKQKLPRSAKLQHQRFLFPYLTRLSRKVEAGDAIQQAFKSVLERRASMSSLTDMVLALPWAAVLMGGEMNVI